MGKAVCQSGSSVIVYDDSVISHIDAAMFDAAYWPAASVYTDPWSGRGTVMFVRYHDDDWAVRHYYRGGIVGRWLSDQFLWRGADHSRAFREWELLRRIQAAGLPAPAPVAGRCKRGGAWYSADLITRRLPDVEPYAARFVRGETTPALWHSVGECIARFHNAGFLHADLNAHNLQIDSRDKLYLLDWDRGRQLPPGRWQQNNLARLRRSCIKICRKEEVEFDPAHWRALLDGYASVSTT